MIFLRLLTIIIFLIPLACNAQVAVNGVADLSHHDFSNGNTAYLSGTWEFYWNKLLSPKDFEANQNPEFITVPGPWNYHTDHPTLGYATYRLKVRLPAGHRGLSMYFPIINSAGKVWLNGELAGERGIVNADRSIYHPKLSSLIVAMPEKVNEVEIIVQAENYAYYNAGLGRSPRINTPAAILAALNVSNGIENFFSGCLFAMFLYQLILYFVYQKGKPHLWLAMICLGVSLRAMIVHGGSFLLPDLFPSVSWEAWKKIEFGSVYASMAFFPLYIYYLFEKFAPRKLLWGFIVLASGMVMLVLFTPQYTYGAFLEVVHFGVLLGFAYAFYTIGKAWKAGDHDTRIILFGILAAFPFIMAEILQNTSLVPVNIEFEYLVEMGVLLFLGFQVYLLTNHHAKSYKSLLTHNENLEKAVAERTAELVTTNAVKDRLLSVVSHDIRSPLNNLRSILQVFNNGAMNPQELQRYTSTIEDDLGKTNMLVDNILFWTAGQLKGIKVKPEKLDLNALVEENFQLFHSAAANKRITLKNGLSGKFEIKADLNIIKLVLRNLVSNAIKFTHEGGEIRIHAARNGGTFTFKVADNGVGMDESTLRSAFSAAAGGSSPGTGRENGAGLGLVLCRDYLQRAGGSLTVESMIGKGTTFIIELPA